MEIFSCISHFVGNKNEMRAISFQFFFSIKLHHTQERLQKGIYAEQNT